MDSQIDPLLLTTGGVTSLLVTLGTAMQGIALLLLPLLTISHFTAGLDHSLHGMGDSSVTTIASCGAHRAAVLSRALGGAEGKPSNMMVDQSFVLLDTTCIIESAIAIASSCVVALELRQADLIHDGPHGVRQLTPALQRWLRLQTGKVPLAKRKLLLLVTDADVAEAPRTRLTKIAAASLARMLAGLDAESVLDPNKLFEVQLVTVPTGAEEVAFREVRDQIIISGDSEWTVSASAALMAMERAEAAGLTCPDTAAALSMAEANEAYACVHVADAAARRFAQGLPTLKKSAEAFLANFGAQATSLLDEVQKPLLANCRCCASSHAVAPFRGIASPTAPLDIFIFAVALTLAVVLNLALAVTLALAHAMTHTDPSRGPH